MAYFFGLSTLCLLSNWHPLSHWVIPLIELRVIMMHTYHVTLPCMHTHIDIHHRGLFQLPLFSHPFFRLFSYSVIWAPPHHNKEQPFLDVPHVTMTYIHIKIHSYNVTKVYTDEYTYHVTVTYIDAYMHIIWQIQIHAYMPYEYQIHTCHLPMACTHRCICGCGMHTWMYVYIYVKITKVVVTHCCCC